MSKPPSTLTRLRAWFRQPPVLMRWKVAVTALAAMTLTSGLYYQTRYLNEERVHDAQCARAEGREAVRLVLFQITSLSDVFGHTSNIDLYEKSRRSIIEAVLPPIEVAGCPKASA